MTDLLPTTIAPGDPNHPALHNASNARINALHTQTLFFGSDALVPIAGSPNLNVGQLLSAWMLDPATTEILSSTFFSPWGWATAKVNVWIATPATQSGGITLQVRARPNLAAGDVYMSGEVVVATTTTPAPTAFTLTRVEIATPIALSSSPETPRLTNVSVRRIGSDGSDTFPSDVGIVGLELVRLA